MPEPKTETVCVCCKRVVSDKAPEGTCWECRGRPTVEGRPRRLAGLRDPQCPHAWAGESA